MQSCCYVVSLSKKVARGLACTKLKCLSCAHVGIPVLVRWAAIAVLHTLAGGIAFFALCVVSHNR